VIGGNVVITILESRGDRVRIGVDAPAEVPIHREEVFRRVEAERHIAVLVDAPNESAFHPEFA
jgi:carbon storage regulator